MKTFIIFLFFVVVSSVYAKVGVCEVQPPAKKQIYLDCLIKEANKTGDVADINLVAKAYDVYGPKDKVVEWYKKSIQKGDAKAMYEVAYFYKDIFVETKNIKEGKYKGVMLKAVKKGLANIPKKFNQPKKAIELYKKAALLHYEDAIAELSKTMEAVYGKEGAIQEYKKEMAQGDKNSYKFLANLYVRYGSYDKALSLYETQLKKEPKNAEIYALIGSLYETQLKDKKRAKEYYEKAAKLGNASAMYNLGIRAGNDKNYEKAKEWFIAAEKAGEKNASRMICSMYHYKLNDDKKAEECYLKLAKKGDAENMSALGFFYRRTIHEYQKSIAWNKKAYKAGDSQAAIGLGAHYSSKYEGEYNKPKAIYWYKKAAGMGESGGWSYLYEQEVFK